VGANVTGPTGNEDIARHIDGCSYGLNSAGLRVEVSREQGVLEGAAAMEASDQRSSQYPFVGIYFFPGRFALTAKT
jgi:hypothetical protein